MEKLRECLDKLEQAEIQRDQLLEALENMNSFFPDGIKPVRNATIDIYHVYVQNMKQVIANVREELND